jgi:hypothetical protein
LELRPTSARTRVVIIGFSIIAVAGIGFVWHKISSLDQIGAHRYGAKAIANVSGTTVYLKREAGLRFDRLSLSINGDRCIGPNDNTDYVFRALGAGDYPISYVQRQSGLVIYGELNPPQNSQWPLEVEQRKLANGAGVYRHVGSFEAQIRITELHPCE